MKTVTKALRLRAFRQIARTIPLAVDGRSPLRIWLIAYHAAITIDGLQPSIAEVSRAAWGTSASPGALANSFRRAGLARPIDYASVLCLAVFGYLLGSGISTEDAAAFLGHKPDYFWRLVNRVEGTSFHPPLPGRTVLDLMRRRAPLWTARRYLAPRLRTVPDAAWRATFARTTAAPRKDG